MLLREFKLNDYLFGVDEKDLRPRQRQRIVRRLKKEMQELFYGRNLGQPGAPEKR